MDENNVRTMTIGKKLWVLEAKMAELKLLKRVALDLRSYRKMIGIKNYD
jgi:hypothetical protein